MPDISIPEIEAIIAKKLQAIRSLRGFSLKAFALGAQVSPQQMHRYETGENGISGANLFALARHFKISLESFFPTEGLESQPEKFSKFEMEAMTLLQKIDQQKRLPEVIEILRIIAG